MTQHRPFRICSNRGNFQDQERATCYGYVTVEQVDFYHGLYCNASHVDNFVEHKARSIIVSATQYQTVIERCTRRLALLQFAITSIKIGTNLN